MVHVHMDQGGVSPGTGHLGTQGSPGVCSGFGRDNTANAQVRALGEVAVMLSPKRQPERDRGHD